VHERGGRTHELQIGRNRRDAPPEEACMITKLISRLALTMVVAAGLSLTGCASTGNKAEPQMMTGADQQPHPRHDSSIDSHVHKE
jgi:hypothetical protein